MARDEEHGKTARRRADRGHRGRGRERERRFVVILLFDQRVQRFLAYGVLVVILVLIFVAKIQWWSWSGTTGSSSNIINIISSDNNVSFKDQEIGTPLLLRLRQPSSSSRGIARQGSTTTGNNDNNKDTKKSTTSTLNAAEVEAKLKHVSCPPPGCLYVARNIIESEAVKQDLELLRSSSFPQQDRNVAPLTAWPLEKSNTNPIIHHVFDRHVSTMFASLTLTSNRESKTNQDRGFVIHPLRICSGAGPGQQPPDVNPTHHDPTHDPPEEGHEHDFVIGIFDGHSDLGHLVAEQARNEFGPRLVQALTTRAAAAISNQDNPQLPPRETTCHDVYDMWNRQNHNDNHNDIHNHIIIQQALKQTFVELDASFPRAHSLNGGCTASVAVRFGNTIHIANAGDSRTMIMAHDTTTTSRTTTVSTGSTTATGTGTATSADNNSGVATAVVTDFVVYANRLDKPHLPDEQARISAQGGTVFIPPPPKPPSWSRVVQYSSVKQEHVGLAMSRSLGDLEFTQVGVTPEPMVRSFSLRELHQRAHKIQQLAMEQHLTPHQFPKLDELTLDTMVELESEEELYGGDDSRRRHTDHSISGSSSNFEFYVVSASDGLLDARRPSFVANHFGRRLYADQHAPDSDDSAAAESTTTTTTDHDHDHSSTEAAVLLWKEQHPMLACHSLVDLATPPPPREGQPPNYRDDITISVMKVVTS
jgi:serine/threonine protein phosphatase PrpC